VDGAVGVLLLTIAQWAYVAGRFIGLLLSAPFRIPDDFLDVRITHVISGASHGLHRPARIMEVVARRT
jgi:hypothetical protein